jgi:hypothetical protein
MARSSSSSAIETASSARPSIGENLGMRQLRIAPRSPWQNAYAERLIGFRRELTDHLIALGERHLLGRVREYAKFYTTERTCLSIATRQGAGPSSRLRAET